MNVKNYTSGVPVSLTVARIESFLAKAGACSVSKQYGPGGEVAALMFKIQIPNGSTPCIRLPANTDKVYDILRKSVLRPRRGTLARLKDQAQRTAWKLMQDWVEVQVSLIHMQQAEVIEVFLPYVWDEQLQITLYGHFKSSGFKMIADKNL